MNILKTILISFLVSAVSIIGFYYYLPFEINELNSGEEMLGTTITTIAGSDTLKNSRTTINNNFAALNNGKVEVSTTSMALITTLKNLVSVGTLTTGTWNASTLTVAYGGTGSTTLLSNAVLLGNGTGMLKAVPASDDGKVLTLTGGVPAWGDGTIDQTLNYNWTGKHSWTTGTTTFNSQATFNNETSFTGTTTISADLINNTNVLAMTAGETLTGFNTPQPVYISTSTGKVYRSDANDTKTHFQYFGFAITSAGADETVYVQYDGVVSGFSGLTAGRQYYVSDTVGTISTTKGTVIMEVGKAASATQLYLKYNKQLSTAANAMSDNTDYYAFADAVVICEETEGSAGSIIGYRNGVEIIKARDSEASCSFCFASITFNVNRGDTFKCDAERTLDGDYYYYN